jgi:hypothetical protein
MIVPCSLVLIFGALWLRDKATGGHRAVQLTASSTQEMSDAELKLEIINPATSAS